MSPHTAVTATLILAVVFLAGLLGYEKGTLENCRRNKQSTPEICRQISCDTTRI